jgi:predicted Zn-dependent peptidase
MVSTRSAGGVVVGDIDPAVAKAKIEEHFAHFTNPSNEIQGRQLFPCLNER